MLKRAQAKPQWLACGVNAAQERFCEVIMEELRITGLVHPDARLGTTTDPLANMRLWLLDTMQHAPEKTVFLAVDGQMSEAFLNLPDQTDQTALAPGHIGQLSLVEGNWQLDVWQQNPAILMKEVA